MSCSADNNLQVEARRSALTSGPTTYDIRVTLPSGTSIVNTTLGAAGSLLVGSRDQILGLSASGNGPLEVQQDGITRTVISGGNVQLDDRVRVNGDATAHGTITTRTSSPPVTITGTRLAGASITASTITWSVTNPGNSQGAITLQNQQTAAPAPGTYDAVTVNGGSSLYLRSGTYFFSSLDLESNARLYVDSHNGPVFLYVTASIIFRGDLRPLDDGLPKFLLGYLGTAAVTIEAPFMGVLLAPNAALNLQNAPVGHTATFYGLSLVAQPGGMIIRSMPFDWKQVPGFPEPAGGWASVGGGFGNSPTPTMTVDLPASRVVLHTVVLSDGTVTSTPITQPTTPVPVKLPPSFEVAGELANGTVTITFTAGTGTTVTCTYQGNAPTAHPTTQLDLNAGRLATFVNCSDGQPASAQRTGTNFSMQVNPAPGWDATVDLPLEDSACNTPLEYITGYDTRRLHDAFNWNTAPRNIAETNPDGSPAVYYAWVYLRTDADLLNLRRIYVHILSRPLFTQELNRFAGSCGNMRNPGDGTGVMVPVVIPGGTYNALRNMQDPAFRQQNHIAGNPTIFEAVILRNAEVPAGARNANGSINVNVLKASGFRYLNYEPRPLPDQSTIQLNGGVVAIATDALAWLEGAAKSVGQFVTGVIGTIDAALAGHSTFTITLHNMVSELIVNAPGATWHNPMVRAWGKDAGKVIGPGHLHVTLLENLAGFIPETFRSESDEDTGFTFIRPAAHQDRARGSGICIELSNDAARINDFLIPNETCDFRGFDNNLTPNVRAGTFNITDFSVDRDIDLRIFDEQFNMIAQMTDAWRYFQQEVHYTPRTVHVLTGFYADILTKKSDSKPFTFCFHLRNTTISGLTGFIDDLSHGQLPEVDAATMLFGGLANNDIVMPALAVGREVATHEYGHFALCNMMHDEDSFAIDGLVIDTINNDLVPRGNDLRPSTRYINEAFADFISGQVTSVANYGWLGNDNSIDGKYCVEGKSPCFDQNFTGFGAGGPDKREKTGLARIATMIHDVFDQPGAKNTDVAGNADAWFLDPATNQITFTDHQWGSTDGNREHVALPAHFIATFANNLARFADTTGIGYLTPRIVMQSLDATMVAHNETWCERCKIFSLHHDRFQNTDGLRQHEMLEDCRDSRDLNTVLTGPIPDPDLRLDGATCTPCPAGSVSDPDGVCQVCTGTIVGNNCLHCAADAVLDGATAPVTDSPFVFDVTAQAPGDNCPDEFWLQIDHPDAFFTRGATKLSASAESATLNPTTCVQSYQLTFAPLQGADFPPLTTLTQTGQACGRPTGCGPTEIFTCGNLPAFTVNSASELPVTPGGTVTSIRYGSPNIAGRTLTFHMVVPSDGGIITR